VPIGSGTACTSQPGVRPAGVRDLVPLRGQAVWLMFVFKYADLFALRIPAQ
jgi:hypothetical protein